MGGVHLMESMRARGRLRRGHDERRIRHRPAAPWWRLAIAADVVEAGAEAPADRPHGEDRARPRRGCVEGNGSEDSSAATAKDHHVRDRRCRTGRR
ncbi:hypothetical protein B7P34_16305 [Streptosporangium nondiastaticum]|uniref:Uncharacterized protein n=1 Tax=Streptosporangium nondiastaticum TaxID=35764 RepID=A0A9X7JQ33_9ACTN|nr:hypothetical protein B7P34_16305 [Streptosporangium nondiastaticum]